MIYVLRELLGNSGKEVDDDPVDGAFGSVEYPERRVLNSARFRLPK